MNKLILILVVSLGFYSTGSFAAVNMCNNTNATVLAFGDQGGGILVAPG